MRSLQNLKRTAKNAASIPPVLAAYRWLYEREFGSGKLPHAFRGVFPSFADAAASAPTKGFMGYDNSEAADMYHGRPIYPEDYSVLFWLRTLMQPGMRLFDYGGHAGGMFDAFRSVLKLPERFEWEIYDVAAVIEAGRKANVSRPEPRPAFTTDWSHASGAGILLASGSLQYVETSLAERLKGLNRLPDHLVINQLPLHHEHEFSTLQCIGSVFCPYRIFAREKFFSSLHALGYRTVDTWSNPNKSCYIPTYPSHTLYEYSGACLRLERK
jgi:putative methyltransferase (TIGR04325 family)